MSMSSNTGGPVPEVIDPSVLALLPPSSGLGLVLAGLARRANLLEEQAPPGRCAASGRLRPNREMSMSGVSE